MESPKADSKPSAWTSSRILLAFVVVWLVMGLGLWLSVPWGCGFGCGRPPELALDASLGSNGWVTFSISNNINANLAIISVTGYAGTNATAFGSVSLSSNNVVPPNGRLSLPVQFQGMVWQPGVRYSFRLTVSNGDRYGIGPVCLNGC